MDGRVLASGILAASTLAAAGGRMLRSMLYQVSVSDPFVLVAVAALVLAITAMAYVIPTTRILGIDPQSALDAV